MERKIIVVTPEVRKKLREKWAWETIKKALDDEVRTMKTLEIRKTAISLGGKYWE